MDLFDSYFKLMSMCSAFKYNEMNIYIEIIHNFCTYVILFLKSVDIYNISENSKTLTNP